MFSPNTAAGGQARRWMSCPTFLKHHARRRDDEEVKLPRGAGRPARMKAWRTAKAGPRWKITGSNAAPASLMTASFWPCGKKLAGFWNQIDASFVGADVRRLKSFPLPIFKF